MPPMTPLRAYALSMTPRLAPDSSALRTRRSRLHKHGDHSLCRHEHPRIVPCGLGWPEGDPAEAWLTKAERARTPAPAGARPKIVRRTREEAARCRSGDHSACGGLPGHGTCSECGDVVWISSTSASPERRRCRECRTANPRPKGSERVGDPRVCELCGEEYVPMLYGRPDQRWCSKSCAQAWRNGARPPYSKRIVVGMDRKTQLSRIRHQVRRETWDGVTDAEIFERDRWRCGICGKRIGKTFKAPHPRSKSIDHIIPLSQGGDDTAANKRAAHLLCNTTRCNRGGDEQLAMIG